MARVAVVLAVVVRSAFRNARGIGGFLGNNFFLVIVLLMAEEPTDRPSSTAIFYLVIGLLYAIPLANDLTLRIPAERFGLWPLGRGERALIHAANLVLNPLLAVAIAFAALSRHPAVRVGLLASGVVAPLAAYAFKWLARVLRRFDRLSLLRLIPPFPGPLGGLIQNHVREQLRMLDPYFAAALSLGGIVYRISTPNVDATASLVIGSLVIILMSTLAQAHLGFDSASENTRERLLPISGAAVLWARDAAWFAIVAALAAGYASWPVVTEAFIALAIGHSQVARPRVEQKRGHFASGALWPVGIGQTLGIPVAGAFAHRFGLPVALASVVVYAVSLYYYGRKLRRAWADDVESVAGTGAAGPA